MKLEKMAELERNNLELREDLLVIRSKEKINKE
jgi:hypothetical protein